MHAVENKVRIEGERRGLRRKQVRQEGGQGMEMEIGTVVKKW